MLIKRIRILKTSVYRKVMPPPLYGGDMTSIQAVCDLVVGEINLKDRITQPIKFKKTLFLI